MPDAYRLDRNSDTGDEQAPIDESSATDTAQRESFGRRFRRLVSGLRDSSLAQSLLSRRPWVILVLVLVYFAVYTDDLRVINLTGQIVLKHYQLIGNYQFDVSTLPTGMYIIKLITADKHLQIKFVKN